MNNAPLYKAAMKTVNGSQAVIIIDLCVPGRMSVTNGAERVLQEVRALFGALPEQIYYRDSEGSWAQMHEQHDGNVVFSDVPASKYDELALGDEQ